MQQKMANLNYHPGPDFFYYFATIELCEFIMPETLRNLKSKLTDRLVKFVFRCFAKKIFVLNNEKLNGSGE